MWLLLFLICPVLGFDCGYPSLCWCSGWGDLVTCYGNAVYTFPTFDGYIKHTTSHIDILNTTITTLPYLDDWTALLTMDIRDNELLPCSEVLTLRQKLYVTSDCYFLSTSSDHPWEWFLLLMLPLLGLPMFALYRKKSSTQTRPQTLPLETVV